MKKLVLSFAVLFVSMSALAQEPFIGPKDLQLYVDGKPFFVRGMVYSPEPRGLALDPRGFGIRPPYKPPFPDSYKGNYISNAQKNQNGWYYFLGAWMCMPVEQNAKGDYVSPCWDDDFTGLLTGEDSWKENAKFNRVVQDKFNTDLSNMQQLGINTVRLYNVNPTGKEHQTFLKAAKDHGMQVIFPLLTTYLADLNDPNLPKYETFVKKLVDETCPGGQLNPAILAYSVGNEFGSPTDAGTAHRYQRALETIELVRKVCPKALITYAHNDDITQWPIINGKSPVMEALKDKIDFLTVNEYRNDDNGGISVYDDFFTKTIKPFTRTYTKPILIGETGEHQNSNFQSNWFNREWKFILENSRANGNLGAVFFEYTDEPVKKFQNKPSNNNDAFMGILSAGWPTVSDMDNPVNVADIKKTKSYAGIPIFTSKDGSKVDFGAASRKGAGRYEMFDNDGKGIAGCSYKWSSDPDNISDECKKAK